MEPGRISDSNLLLTAPLDNSEVAELQARQENGVIKTMWVASNFKERLRFLFKGEIYISVISKVSQPPIRASVNDD